MKKAIKALQKRIEVLNAELEKVECVISGETEMVCDYEFALSDAANLSMEISELEQAIIILNDHVL